MNKTAMNIHVQVFEWTNAFISPGQIPRNGTVRLYGKVMLNFLMKGFPCGSAGKESACNVGDLDSIAGLGRSPGEGKATHWSILAWRIPWTVQSMGSQRVGHD